jgi:hypothetical protein
MGKDHSPAAQGVTNHVGETSLSSAIGELHKQHPHPQDQRSDQRGPFHGGDEHCRHIPVIKSNSGPYSR